MKELLFGVVSLVVTVACGVTPVRIGEIAAWLPKEPAADGARIDDRTKWDALAALPQAKEEVGKAEGLLDKPVPEVSDEFYLDFTRNGNRSRYQDQFYRRLYSFTSLFLAECYENGGRFIPKIVEYVDAYCAMRSWVLPAHDDTLECFNGDPHVDLVSGDIALRLAFCRDWLGDRLPEATRGKIVAETDRRVFQPVLRTARGLDRSKWHWWLKGENNWNSVCNSCVLRSALALVRDRRLRAEFIAIAEESAPYALRGYTADGYCLEGMDYWNYGFGHYIRMGLSVRTATGGKVDFFADPKCGAVMRYAYGFQMEDGKSPHFADGGGNVDPCVLALGRQVWPELANEAALDCPLLAGGPATFSLRAFGQEPARGEPTMGVLPKRSWFPDAQVLISRIHSEDRAMDFGIALKGGHNAECHGHNDLGSYYVMLDGVEMSGDPDGEIYTSRTFSDRRFESKVLNSYGHPVPVIGGELQRPGREAAAKVLRADFSDRKDLVEIEYAAAYPVKALKSLVRTMVVDRVADRIAIRDRVTCTEPTAFEVPVITYRSWEKNDAATEFVFRKDVPGSREMTMKVQASAPVRFEKEIIENPGLPDVQRLVFRFEKPVTEATFTTVFSTQEARPDGVVRIGVMSDTHIGCEGTAERLEQCYRLFKAKGVDHIFNLGDICETFDPKLFAEYVRIREKAYGKELPPETYLYAGHDQFDAPVQRPDPESAKAFAEVKRMLGIPNERYDRRVIGGHVFLIYPQFKDFARMAREIDAECAAHPGRPLFVLDHIPPAMTVSGSEIGGDWDARRIFDRHPEVVALSGHVHSSLAYEGNVWQGAFTAVGIGANKDTTHVSNRYYAMVIELTKDRAVLRRYDIASGEELGGQDPWTLDFPFDPKNAPYEFSNRSKKFGVPTFPSRASIRVAYKGSPAQAIVLSVPEAKNAAQYSVAIETKRDGKWATRTLLSSRRPQLEIESGNFDEGETVRFKVRAIGHFRDEGATLLRETKIGALEKWHVAYDGVPPPAKPGEWFKFAGGTYFDVPPEAMAFKPGTRMRVTLEAGVRVPSDMAASFNLRTKDTGTYAYGYFYTPVGGADGEMRRYTRLFTRPWNEKEQYRLFLNSSNWSYMRGEVLFGRFRLEWR